MKNAIRILLAVYVCVVTICRAENRNPSSLVTPQWIRVDRTGRLLRTFQSPAVQSATLRMAGDFCRTLVTVNGEQVLRIEPYCQTQELDVTNFLRLGENKIEVDITPVSGAPAAVAAEIDVLATDGQRIVVRTDELWTIVSLNEKPQKPVLGGAVRPELWGVGRRRISNDPFDNYEQWQQAKGGNGKSPRFSLAPGFEITQLRVAQPNEGSWVSLACDDRGRLVIGREDQGFLRMTVSENAETIAQVQPVTSDLLECRGLVFREGWYYASANNSKKIVRFKVSDEGQVTDLVTLREFPGGVGHGRNDLHVGPDSLLLINGDSVDSPNDNQLDYTSPLRKGVAGKHIKEGTLLRSSLDGQHWELLSGGLRNPYGVDVHPEYGDPFTYDADNEYDLGMPWYRPTRILQLIPGGDYGYREATKVLPPRFADQADDAPPLIDIGRGSPTSIMFGFQLQFPSPYRQALFALDWTYGRVLAIHLSPRGAGYRASTELFLQGKPLNVTDIVAGQEGAMYLITGGRKTQSALYRVSAVKATGDEVETEKPVLSAYESETLSYSSKQREIARRLQESVVTTDRMNWESLKPLLKDADPVVRYSAQTALERIPASEWVPMVLSSPVSELPMPALLAAARLLDATHTPRILEQWKAIPMELADDFDKHLMRIRILELCLQVDQDAVLKQRDAVETQLISAWQTSAAVHQQISSEGTRADFLRRSALLLAAIQYPRLAKFVDSELLSSSTQEDQIAGVMALRNFREEIDPEIRTRQLHILASIPQMVGGEGLPAIHTWLEKETLETLTPELREQYARIKASLSEPEPLPPARPQVKKWVLDDLTEVIENSAAGDAQRGRQIFQTALCARCHRFADQGRSVGPELTQVAGRFSRHDILDSILNPSKAIAENYQGVTIQTTEGKVITGRVIPGGDFRSEKLRISTDLLRPDQIVEVDKKLIEEHHPSAVSPMPQGLLDTLTFEEIRDLLAYLTRSGN